MSQQSQLNADINRGNAFVGNWLRQQFQGKKDHGAHIRAGQKAGSPLQQLSSFGDWAERQLNPGAPAPAARPAAAPPSAARPASPFAGARQTNFESIQRTGQGMPSAAPARPAPAPAAAPAPARGGVPAPARSGGMTGSTAGAPAAAPAAMAKASAPTAAGGEPLSFGYTPNLEAHSNASLNELSDSDFESLRRRAFLDSSDSMAGMRQVRELLAQRNGYSAEEARKLSVAALEKPKAPSSDRLADSGAVGQWNLSNATGAGAQADYSTAGEKDLDEALALLPNAAALANQPPGGSQWFGEDSVYGVADFTANPNLEVAFAGRNGDANTNPNQPNEQMTIAARAAVTENAPGGGATQAQSSADGTVSGELSGELADPNQLGSHSYEAARQMQPGGQDFRALTNDWAQSATGLRGRLNALDLSQVAPWQMGQQPIVMNGDGTRDGRMAAFAAMGENDPSRTATEALAASPFGTRDGQSMQGATIDLSHLDARKVYGTNNRPVQVRSGVPGFNPGNF